MPSKPSATNIELPLDYYHQNFCQLLKVVQQRYGDLLNEQERQFYAAFFQASKAAQCLYVRLSGRSKSIFRLSKLHYVEIPQLAKAAQELHALALLELSPALSIEQLLPLFTKPELLSLLQPEGAKKLSRAALEQHLIDSADEQMLHTLQQADTLLAVQQEEHLPVFKLCFFGNLYQDLSEFVLRDLAIFQYEDYSLDSQSRQFVDRAQLEQHLLYYASSQLSEEAVQQGPEAIVALCEALPTPAAEDRSLQRRVARLRNNLARDLERQKHEQLALMLYQQSAQPPARERRARIHMAAGEIEQSLALCKEILQKPADEAEAVFAQQFGQRHAKRHGKDWPQNTAYTPPVTQLTLPKGDSVEQQTANHLGRCGECFFVENTLFSSVLGLALWPAVFAPVRGAFSHPFQHKPHDFFDTGFVQQRAQLIQDELQLQISDQQQFNRQILARHQGKYGLANPLVYWNNLEQTLLEKALLQIPVAHWQAVFNRLLADLRNHRNGLPDLIYFPADGGYELVEVKGPGDRLQENQKRWMTFFQAQGIPHWVAHISWAEDLSES